MPEKKKLFKELKGGETFSVKDAHIFENGIPGRSWLYVRIENTNQALFLPTGTVHSFNLEKEVFASDIKITLK